MTILYTQEQVTTIEPVKLNYINELQINVKKTDDKMSSLLKSRTGINTMQKDEHMKIHSIDNMQFRLRVSGW